MSQLSIETDGRSRPICFSVAAVCLAVAALALVAACAAGQPTPVPGGATATPATPSGSAEPQPTGVDAEATPVAAAPVTLTVWTTEAFSPTQAITSGAILAQQAALFEESLPDVRLRFVLKKPSGKAGVLDYLLTTGAVVPDLLPDLVLIDVDDLPAAVQGDWVQPLDGLVDAELTADLYPFARQACTFDGQLYGLQFYADLEQLVYNPSRMSAPPRSWSELLGITGPYVFPAGGQSGLVNDAFLIQYLAVRAVPPGSEEPFLDGGSLAAVLQFYQNALSRRIFPPAIAGYRSTEEGWRDFLGGQAAAAHVNAHRLLSDWRRAPTMAVAPIPSINGPAAPIGGGWALALITADPGRADLAVRFMVQLMDPGTQAAWNQAAGYLPTRQAALAHWQPTGLLTRPGMAEYVPFIQGQLSVALPRPRLPNYTQVMAALQEAVEGVVAGTLSPEEATAQVLNESQ